MKLHFSIRDTGIGIPADKQKLIFTAFEQADLSTTRKYGGTGLGLTISSRLVALMNGTMSVESEWGHGSDFHFTVELTTAREQEQPASPEISKCEAPLRPLRILVAEDNPVNQRLACKQLERLGHSVVLASTGVQALEMLERQLFDLVFMDVQMPEMDGLEAARLLRQKEAFSGTHLPVVAMTAHAMEGDREICLNAGMDSYVSKPIVKNLMLAAMSEALALAKPIIAR